MSQEPCDCSAETVCGRHLRRYERQLAELPALLAELDRTARRQTSAGGLVGGSSKGKSAPLPFDPAASDLAREIRAWVTERGQYSFAAALAWLLRTAHEASGWPDGVRWLDDASGRARRMVLGRQRDRWFAGVCGAELVSVGLVADGSVLVPVAEDAGRCEALLFASVDVESVKCRACEAVYTVEARRSLLVAFAQDAELPLPVIARALPWLAAVEVRPSTVRNWRLAKLDRRPTFVVTSRGVAQPRRLRKPPMLLPRAVDAEGRELFRVGDVIDLAVAAAERSVARVKLTAG